MCPDTKNNATLAILAIACGMLASPSFAGDSGLVKRGAALVSIGGCTDCHTPFKMGPNGPEKDMARGLSGHPEALLLPPPPQLAAAWNWAGAATMTAFVGPWGTTYSANLTPDKETGIGAWTEKQFIQNLRSGKHVSGARPIMPPMPWPALAKLSDQDLRAVFAYLKAQPAIRNKVPDYQPPTGTLTKAD